MSIPSYSDFQSDFVTFAKYFYNYQVSDHYFGGLSNCDHVQEARSKLCNVTNNMCKSHFFNFLTLHQSLRYSRPEDQFFEITAKLTPKKTYRFLRKLLQQFQLVQSIEEESDRDSEEINQEFSFQSTRQLIKFFIGIVHYLPDILIDQLISVEDTYRRNAIELMMSLVW